MLIGITSSPDTIPSVGFIVYNEVLVAGCTRDPKVSVPMARGVRPALIAIADPEEEPDGIYDA